MDMGIQDIFHSNEEIQYSRKEGSSSSSNFHKKKDSLEDIVLEFPDLDDENEQSKPKLEQSNKLPIRFCRPCTANTINEIRKDL